MEIVSALQTALTERIGQERFDVWFGGSVTLELLGQTLNVVAANSFHTERLRKAFRADLEWIGRHGPWPFTGVAFHSQPQEVRTPGRRPVARHNPVVEKPIAAAKTLPRANGPKNGRTTTLDQFIVGESNRLAFAGARSAARKPGQLSPLFFYGPSGTGKTHLLQAISTAGRREGGLRRVVMLSAEQFTTSFVEALRGSGLPSFRRKYRDVEMLLIDDVHFFNGKKATVEELLHTVDELLNDGRQLVFSADRPPSELAVLGAELVGRISGGLVCGLEPLDEATRLGLARQLAAASHYRVPDDVLQLIAAQVFGDARLVAGAIHRLAAASMAAGQPIDRPLAERTLHEFFRMTRRVVQLSDIQSAVCEVFGIDVKSLQSGRKSKVLCQPRMLAMWLARKYTRAAYAEIGEYFGRRSHSTVISAQKKVQDWVSSGGKIQLGYGDCDVRDAIRRVENRLGAG